MVGWCVRGHYIVRFIDYAHNCARNQSVSFLQASLVEDGLQDVFESRGRNSFVDEIHKSLFWGPVVRGAKHLQLPFSDVFVVFFSECQAFKFHKGSWRGRMAIRLQNSIARSAFSSCLYSPCDLRQITSPLCGSISRSVKLG